MASQRWSTDKNIQFIDAYQRQECLWDPKHLQYKNRDARDAAYKSIMEAMEMQNVKEVVSKIRSLRNTYNNELLKTKKSNITGMATNELYISKIPWLSHLDFLKNIDSYTRENTENVTPNIQRTSTSDSETQDFTVPSIPPRNKRKIKDPLLKAVDVLEKVSTQHFSNASNDEFDLFGQTIAQQLRQLPLEIALETEEMILSTVRKQRIKLAKQQTSAQQVRLRASSSEPDTFHSTSGTSGVIADNEYLRASSSEPDTFRSTSGTSGVIADNEYPYDQDYDVLARAVASIRHDSMSVSELSFDQY